MRPESTNAGHRVGWPVLIALVLVPLLVVASLLGLTRASGLQKVNAAIVNLDEMVTINGQPVPMGRQLAAAMMDREGDNITWTLADAKHAKDGLASGEYAAVVTIPESFSAAATSFSANDAAKARQATVQIQVSENSPVTDAALAQEIAGLAKTTINSTLTQGYLDNIYIGFNTVKEQFTTIVDGASQLNDGATQLADGTGKTSDGATQLADGLQQLKSGGVELNDGGAKLDSGGQQLINGAAELATGTKDLASGARQLADGANQLSDGLGQFRTKSGQLVTGINQLADGAHQLLGNLPAYTTGVKQALGGVVPLKAGIDKVIAGLSAGSTDTSALKPLVDGAAQLADGAEGLSGGLAKADQTLQAFTSGAAPAPVAPPAGLAGQIAAGFTCPTGTDPATCGMLQAVFEQGATAGVNAGFTAGFRSGTGTASAILNTPGPTGASLLKGADQLATGARTLSDNVAGLPGQLQKQAAEQLGELKAGLQQISDGAGTLISRSQPLVDRADSIGDGVTQLDGGIQQLKTQVAALPAGVTQLADGASQLSTGTTKMANGADQLAQGSGDFSDGVAAYADGVGQFVAGVEKYTAGAGSAADGASKLAAGIVQLDDGAEKLAEGTSTFASKLREGADQVPTYSAEQRQVLSTVVASPVEQSDSLLSANRAALVALLLVAGLWLGALASFVVARPVPSDVVASSASSAVLWGRTVGLPALIAAGTGALFGVVGSVILGLSIGRSAGLVGLLAVLGVGFVLVNHALAAWFGNIGRGISLVLLAASVALGLSSASGGWITSLASVSPLQNGLALTRTWLSSGSGMAALVGGFLLIGAIAVGLSYLSIAARRQVKAAQYRRRVTAA